ncbi:MAG: hypothetical protein ACRDHZ_25460 [Ktedonobacteraceae bacterium]
MPFPKFALALVIALGFVWTQSPRATKGRVLEGTISIPTYLMAPQDPDPPFQLVDGHNIYSYTVLDDLTNDRETKTYKLDPELWQGTSAASTPRQFQSMRSHYAFLQRLKASQADIKCRRIIELILSREV